MFPTPLTENLILITRRVYGKIQSEWRSLLASDLGSNSSGTGNKYLADDMTWKSISSSGGSGIFLDFGHRFSTSPGTFINLGNRFG